MFYLYISYNIGESCLVRIVISEGAPTRGHSGLHPTQESTALGVVDLRA